MALDDIGRSQDGGTGAFPTVYQELLDIFDETVTALRESADSKGLDATGVLQASITFEPKIIGDFLRFQLKMADYYEWADKGRKPGKFPPLKPILDWMKAKGIVPRNERGKRLKTTRKSLENLAFAIRKKIAQKGTIKRFGYKGSNFYTDVIPSEDAFVAKVVKRISAAAKQDILVELKYYDK